MKQPTHRVSLSIVFDHPEEYTDLADRWMQLTLKGAQDDLLERLMESRDTESQINLIIKFEHHEITLLDRIVYWYQTMKVKYFPSKDTSMENPYE